MPKIKDGRIIDDPAPPGQKTGPTYHLRQPIAKRPSLARRWSREARRLIGPLAGPGGGAGCGPKAIAITVVAVILVAAFVLAAIFFGGRNADESPSPSPTATAADTGLHP
jgi:hypothetical protein